MPAIKKKAWLANCNDMHEQIKKDLMSEAAIPIFECIPSVCP